MDASDNSPAIPACRITDDSPAHLRLDFSGDLTARTIGPLWKQCVHSIKCSPAQKITLDAAGIDICDGAGIGLLSYLRNTGQKRGKTTQIIGLRCELKELLDRFQKMTATPEPPVASLNAVETIGKQIVEFLLDIYEQIAFAAAVFVTALKLVFKPRAFRWKDFFKIAEYAGVRAVGIVALLGLLFGLIMAFSSAMPLKQFGVEIYVADLVALALVRVLGPFVTAVIVAGRTGSAFAAEIGTMKVNHEIDALEVMNLDPIAFLVVPRVWATTLMTPLLSIAANLLGLAGAALVIVSLGYPLVTYNAHVQTILSIPDVLVGLFKAIVYGGLIGTVGCLRGLQTNIGAGAVGISTTRAVVTSIILLVIAEGIFSVLLYFLEI